MIEDYENKNANRCATCVQVMDYVMGFLFFCIGVYFLTYRQIGINIFRREPSSIDYLIGGLFVVYGIWRMYRGYRKNYFRE
jgi:hypothetical protein